MSIFIFSMFLLAVGLILAVIAILTTVLYGHDMSDIIVIISVVIVCGVALIVGINIDYNYFDSKGYDATFQEFLQVYDTDEVQDVLNNIDNNIKKEILERIGL